MRRALCLLAALTVSGCVIKDELDDGIREVRPSVRAIELARFADSSGRLEFTFHYQLGIVDEAGIAEVIWTYALIDPADRRVLAETTQRMRKPDPGKTEILVEGDRARSLDVPAGQVQDGVNYVLWITLSYRDEPLGEHLASVSTAGPGRGVSFDAGVSP